MHSQQWALVVAGLAGLLAILLGTKKKAGLAILPSFISAIALFVGYPDMLQPSWLNLEKNGTIIVGLIGALVTALTFAIKKAPKVLVLVGIVIVTWAACRLIPALPPAFAQLGTDLGSTGGNLWDSVKKFFTKATG